MVLVLATLCLKALKLHGLLLLLSFLFFSSLTHSRVRMFTIFYIFKNTLNREGLTPMMSLMSSIQAQPPLQRVNQDEERRY